MEQNDFILNDLREKGLILLECVVGSTAYGINLPTSDIDKKIIYCASLDDLLSNNIKAQININKDFVAYEVGRFCELLWSANPNCYELLNPPKDCIIYMHPLYKKYFIDNVNNFIISKIKFSFGSYSFSQISKARGIKKKMMNPMPKERKGLLDFCYTAKENGSIPLKIFLQNKRIEAEACGCVVIDHMVFVC